MIERIKKWYELGVWDERKLREAAAKDVITAEQFKEITGKGLSGASE